jgi:TorA maturation chaperone TorD
MTIQVKSSAKIPHFLADVGEINSTLETVSSTDLEFDDNQFVPENSQLVLEQQYRSSSYSLLGALLRSAPNQNLLDILSELVSEGESREDDALLLSMSTLSMSSKLISPESIEDEYHQLFIGLGKGEVVPYGSWYLTGFLMEKPLSDLRHDLSILGFERNENVCEPEDHAAALCEVFSLLISEGNTLDQQYQFYKTHMEPWIGLFLNDLIEAKSAVYYKSVGRFGSAFIAFESEYFSMQT